MSDKPLTDLHDRDLATYYFATDVALNVRPSSPDLTEDYLAAENEIIKRLSIPEEYTEQGLTPEANALIGAWVRLHSPQARVNWHHR